MVPPKGWRARAAVARARRAPPARDEALIRAERARIYAEREAAIAAERPAPSEGPKGPVTAADMLKPVAPPIEDVTPDEDEAPEAEEPATEEPDAEEPDAPSTEEPVTPPVTEPEAAKPAPKKAAKAPAKKS